MHPLAHDLDRAATQPEKFNEESETPTYVICLYEIAGGFADMIRIQVSHLCCSLGEHRDLPRQYIRCGLQTNESF